MRHPWILIAPLLLAAPHTAGATVATAPVPEAPPTEAIESEALETPAQAEDPPEGAYEAPGPRLANLVSWDGDVEAFAPPLRAIADDPPSDERTPRPTPEEWKAADEVALARAQQRCTARRVREWLRIGCEVWSNLAAMDLLAGPREGVSFEAKDGWSVEQAVTFPVRRGDRRVLQIVLVASASKYSIDYDTAFTISEDWLAGAKGPTVVVD